jgi:uncharacterized alkaline shock family protein YloU
LTLIPKRPIFAVGCSHTRKSCLQASLPFHLFTEMGLQKGFFMAVESQSIGVVRVTRQVLSTIVINTALQIPGVVRIAQASDQWSRLLGREMLRQGVKITVKDNTVTTDLYIVVNAGSNIVEVGTSLQEEVASALENMTGMQVREVNVYIQDVV